MRVEQPTGEAEVRATWLKVTETTRAQRDDGIVVSVHVRTELFLDFDPVGPCCQDGNTADRGVIAPSPSRALGADTRP